MGEGVERHASLHTGERIAPQVGHPSMPELMQTDGDNQQDELQATPAKMLNIHIHGRRWG